MKLPRPRMILPALPAAGLANVTLLLVFFFALATSFGGERASVDLPVAPQLAEAAPGAACLTVRRRVSAAEGESLRWRFEDGLGGAEDISGPEGLFLAISRVVDDDPERTFLLRIDADVRYRTVDDALEALRKAGARNVVFCSKAPGGHGA